MDIDETAALRGVTRSYLEARCSWTADQHLAAAGEFDRAAWKQMAEQLGLQGVRIAEELGGSGLGRDAELLVHHEMGRALYNGPYLGTTQVAAALSQLAGDGRSTTWLAAIAAGDLIAVPAMPVEESFPLTYPIVTRADDVLQLTGSLPCVIDAQIADALLVLADFEGSHAFVWLETTAPGLVVTPLETIDITRRMAEVRFDRAPVTLVAVQDSARAAVAAVRQGTALALASESVGLAERSLEMTVAYVKIRTQFGQVIGSFQAIKHTCAELLIRLESARSALTIAAAAVEQNDPVGRRPASLAGLAVARMYCGRNSYLIANEAIHLHGGIGFTWEHPAHLYFRRAKSNQLLLDSTGQQGRLLTSSVLAMHQEQH